jgi:hypothetical protein
VPGEIGHRLPAHAEPDQDQRPVRPRVRVDHRHGLLEPAPQAQLGEFSRAFAVPGEVEGDPATAAGHELPYQRQQSLRAAGARAVQHHSGDPGRITAVHTAEPFTFMVVREVEEHAPYSLTPWPPSFGSITAGTRPLVVICSGMGRLGCPG